MEQGCGTENKSSGTLSLNGRTDLPRESPSKKRGGGGKGRDDKKEGKGGVRWHTGGTKTPRPFWYDRCIRPHGRGWVQMLKN